MKFDEWAEDYFGENVSAPEACQDAWNAGREPLKDLLRDALPFCDLVSCDLKFRIRDALGEPITDSQRLTAAGYRRRPGRKAIGEDE